MIYTSPKLIIEAGQAVIINPITVEGNFLVKSIAETYPRSLRCMQSIANQDLIALGRLYNYHEVTCPPKPEFLINICCATSDKSGIVLTKFEEALFLIATNFISKHYTYKVVAIPKIINWELDANKQDIIEKLFDRYFSNLKTIDNIMYYYA